MTTKLNMTRVHALQTDALENIHSYMDPETPNALEQFTAKIKTILLAEPKLLESLPEYLPIALYGRVKFSAANTTQWQQWISKASVPSWDEFKTSVAFSNSDLELVKAVRSYSEAALIEACAVLFLLENDNVKPTSRSSAAEPEHDDDDDADAEHNYDNDDYTNDDDEDEEDGYNDQYDDIRFKGE